MDVITYPCWDLSKSILVKVTTGGIRLFARLILASSYCMGCGGQHVVTAVVDSVADRTANRWCTDVWVCLCRCKDTNNVLSLATETWSLHLRQDHSMITP